MTYVNSEFDFASNLVKHCLKVMYDVDHDLFVRNKGNGVCERCLVFRLAHYLQRELDGRFFVDCDFNSTHIAERADNGTWKLRNEAGKLIINVDGTTTKRFVDIIVHGRDYIAGHNFMCFELKKWNNRKGAAKDENNLRVLTSNYQYRYGFLISIGQELKQCKWKIFQSGEQLGEEQLTFGN